MNEMTRNIDTITAEIVVIRENAKKVFFSAVIDIGKRLLEAKELVPQGEWLHYLDTALGYKPSTAQNYMRIAKEFAADQIGMDGRSQSEVFGELGYSQLIPLLGLPEEERREIAEENEGKIKVGKVNVDDESDLAAEFRISSIPTLLVFKNGQIVHTSVGYRPKEQILELLK